MRENLTESDIKKIEAEIEDRILNKRPVLIEAVKEARAQGDLSENFEYYAAKREKNRNESRIRYLQRIINTAEIIEDDSNDDEVGLNKLVALEFLKDHLIQEFKIVTSIRSSSLKNYLSIESPVGKAIIGHKEGDIVDVTVNKNNSFQVKILTITPNLGDEDDDIRSF